MSACLAKLTAPLDSLVPQYFSGLGHMGAGLKTVLLRRIDHLQSFFFRNNQKHDSENVNFT